MMVPPLSAFSSCPYCTILYTCIRTSSVVLLRFSSVLLQWFLHRILYVVIVISLWHQPLTLWHQPSTCCIHLDEIPNEIVNIKIYLHICTLFSIERTAPLDLASQARFAYSGLNWSIIKSTFFWLLLIRSFFVKRPSGPIEREFFF